MMMVMRLCLGWLGVAAGVPELPHPSLPAGELLPGLPVWLWVLLGLLLAGLVTLVVVRALRLLRGGGSSPKGRPLEAALRELEAVRAEAADLPVREVATRVSLIVRSYLEEVFDDPALFETSEEFGEREVPLEAVPRGARDRVCPFLQELSDYKYRPGFSAGEESVRLLDEAKTILSHLDQTLPAI